MLGEKLQLEPLEVAAGIYEIVNENMAAAARVHVAEKGYDPREFTLVATGGAGPVHAVEVARKLGIKRVLSPVAAGAGSCLGMLAAPSRVDRSWSKPSPLGTVAWDEVSRKFDELKSEALDEIGKTTSGQQAVNWRITLDMRYVGQGGMIQVTLDGVHVGSADVQRIEAAFEKRYESIYGRTVPNSKIEVITWRITAETAKQAKNFVLGLDSQGASTQPVSIRDIYIPARKSYAKAPVYKRYALPPGAKVAGPAVLEERESTIVIPVAAEISILSDLTVDIQIQEF
jgi:N-methylhydantoinase A